MKKITIIAALALTFSFAQANDIVGYAKVTANSGELSFVSLNFEATDSTLDDLIGTQLPNGSVIHVWDKSSGAYITSNKGGRGGYVPNTTLNLGDAFWIQAGGSGSHEVILSGSVKTDAQNVSDIAAGIDASGLYFPVETTFGATDLISELSPGNVIHFWDGDAQTYASYNAPGRGSFSAAAQAHVITPTSAFWVESSGFTWEESRPFDVD